MSGHTKSQGVTQEFDLPGKVFMGLYYFISIRLFQIFSTGIYQTSQQL
jgi:hypothetical protein